MKVRLYPKSPDRLINDNDSCRGFMSGLMRDHNLSFADVSKIDNANLKQVNMIGSEGKPILESWWQVIKDNPNCILVLNVFFTIIMLFLIILLFI